MSRRKYDPGKKQTKKEKAAAVATLIIPKKYETTPVKQDTPMEQDDPKDTTDGTVNLDIIDTNEDLFDPFHEDQKRYVAQLMMASNLNQGMRNRQKFSRQKILSSPSPDNARKGDKV